MEFDLENLSPEQLDKALVEVERKLAEPHLDYASVENLSLLSAKIQSYQHNLYKKQIRTV